MAITIHCDACGCVLAERVRPLTVSGWKDGYSSRRDHFHFCEKCFDELKSWLNTCKEDVPTDPEVPY